MILFFVISNMHSRIFGFIYSYEYEIDSFNTELNIIVCVVSFLDISEFSIEKIAKSYYTTLSRIISGNHYNLIEYD